MIKKLLINLGQKISFLWIGATIRFKNWVWDIDWRRDTVLLVLALLLVRYFLQSNWIDNFIEKIYFTQGLLIPYTENQWFLILDLLLIPIFCAFIAVSVAVAKILSQLKEVKLFSIFVASFLIIKFWNIFIGSLNSLIQSVFNNINGIIESIISSRIHDPPNLTTDEINNITQDIFVKTISSLFTLTNILQLIALILLGTLLYLFLWSFRGLKSGSRNFKDNLLT